MEDENVVEVIQCEPGKKKRMYMQSRGENQSTFPLMRTGAEALNSMKGMRFFDSLYMCFADFRRLTADEKYAYIMKERQRVCQSMHSSNFFTILLRQEWGYVRLEQGIRDVYYRLYQRFENDKKGTTTPDDNGNIEPLDQIINDLLETCTSDLAYVWLQTMSPKRFEVDILENVRQKVSSFVYEPDNPENGFMDLSLVQNAFNGFVRDTLDQRFQKWTNKGKFVMDTSEKEKLYQVMHNFSELFFQCACEWIIFYYKSLVSGDLDDTDPVGTEPEEFIPLFCAYLPFDCIIVDARTQSPWFDSNRTHYVASAVDATDYNVVVILHFPPADSEECHAFESIGIVCPSASPEGGSKLTRIFPSDDPFILYLRDQTIKPPTSSKPPILSDEPDANVVEIF